jgi:hypothetical protein
MERVAPLMPATSPSATVFLPVEENVVSCTLKFDDVERLEVDVHPDLLNTVRFHKPTQGFRGKFSLDYVKVKEWNIS